MKKFLILVLVALSASLAQAQVVSVKDSTKLTSEQIDARGRYLREVTPKELKKILRGYREELYGYHGALKLTKCLPGRKSWFFIKEVFCPSSGINYDYLKFYVVQCGLDLSKTWRFSKRIYYDDGSEEISVIQVIQ